METDSDKILLAALREGKEKAFDMIFQKYFRSIYQFVCQNCRNKKNAEELTQDVFVILWQNKETPIDSLKGYLYAVARNIVVNWTRQNVNRQLLEILINEQRVLADKSDLSEKLTFERLLSMVHKIAQSMPKRRFEVYQMRWVEGLSRKEIAQRMGISITTVDIHLHKGIEYLHSAMSKLGYKVNLPLLFIITTSYYTL
ncbi:RNA polymerase sigma-70 factor [Bacteroidia bacterium]|nr:RNA polymerase sigma-70 factor [Bacteroidia bacterium]